MKRYFIEWIEFTLYYLFLTFFWLTIIALFLSPLVLSFMFSFWWLLAYVILIPMGLGLWTTFYDDWDNFTDKLCSVIENIFEKEGE